ncbi:hypothetical protein NDU88_005396 [Pleurodeles waltl]|uniref:Uncharacterized protein n=1 Tax=Pleurodeles waltl TaxID=8319 RepID=A0AAV7PFU3_PLEWA|nr:hypothetical protein NDU88_005396 [Pleurodeles waltl]
MRGAPPRPHPRSSQCCAGGPTATRRAPSRLCRSASGAPRDHGRLSASARSSARARRSEGGRSEIPGVAGCLSRSTHSPRPPPAAQEAPTGYFFRRHWPELRV